MNATASAGAPGWKARGEVTLNCIDRFGSRVSELFFPMECRPVAAGEGAFSGSLVSRHLGQLGIAAIRNSPLDVYRRRSHIGQAADSVFLVKVQVGGESVVRQRNREAFLQPGDFTLCSSEEPYELHFARTCSQVVLALPQQILRDVVSNPEQHLGTRMASADGSNGVFSSFVISIAQRLDDMEASLAQRLEVNVLDLLATTLSFADREASAVRLDGHSIRVEYLHRIRRFIHMHLHEDNLGPDSIAAAHNISTRYLHMLFAEGQVSVSRYIQQQRLQACRAALADPALGHQSVCEIALRTGFKDSSHFSRVFKSEFGVTPMQYRRGTIG